MGKRSKKHEIPPQLFCDSSFLVAYFAAQDSNHAEALKIRKFIAKSAVALITTWPMVSETATMLLYHYGYSHACEFLDVLKSFKIIVPDENECLEAIEWFKKFNKDQKISFNDILCFVIVRGRLKNIPVLSFDRDFSKMGLTLFRP